VQTNAAKALDALGDPTRRAVFERLRAGPRSVVEIHRGMPVSRPAVSQHLKVLKDAGLVSDESVGNRRFYRPNQAGIAELRAYLDRFWDQSLAAFKEAAEAAARHAGSDKEKGKRKW
jgi:DNA-binding transcriptional ArsR family regulator